MDLIIEGLKTRNITESNNPKQIKYKNGIKLECDNGDVVRVNRSSKKYVVTGFNKDLDLLPQKVYQSFDGVKKYILKTYNIELIER